MRTAPNQRTGALGDQASAAPSAVSFNADHSRPSAVHTLNPRGPIGLRRPMYAMHALAPTSSMMAPATAPSATPPRARNSQPSSRLV